MRTKKIILAFLMVLLACIANAQMVLEYNIDATNTTIELPLNGTVNVQVDWGDGSALGNFTTSGFKPHTYSAIGIKTVTITGSLTHYGMYSTTFGNARLTKVLSWDGLGLTDLSYAFNNASILTSVPASLPSGVTNLSNMFRNARIFNQPISTWNTETVTAMNNMFLLASAFNQPIGNWNTGAVTDMSYMFSDATNFNQSIGTWNIAAVMNMSGMFYKASAFNQPIGTWNTAAVKDMSLMFYEAKAFNQPIGTWNTSAVQNMVFMFSGAAVFNHPIGTWNIASVTDMNNMFNRATAFNQPIGTWNTASVTNMDAMFSEASAFNQPVGTWNTSAVTNMNGVFSYASAFNQPIENWNTGKVVTMQYMFEGAAAFNQPIGNWNTSAVRTMFRMFADASAFNKPLGNLNITAVADMYNMFLNTSLCTYNYDATLNGWSTQAVKSAVNFNGGNSKYSGLGVNARAALISKGWFITDGGFGLTVDAKCDEVRYYNTIRGKIYTDANADCINQGTEKRLSSIVVKAVPGPYYGFSDSNGDYEIRVDTGTVTYTLTQQFNATHSTLLSNQCAPSHVVSLTGAFKDVGSFDFANNVKSCILPSVNVSHAPLVRCFKSSAYIEYCNLGNVSMNDAVIKVEYPAHLIPVSSVPMWTSKVGSILFYNIGTLQETTCGQIKITDSVDCSPQAVFGLTQCIKVSITPNSTCISQSPLWDFSFTTVVGSCENNQAAFVLTNNGDGNMSDSLAYRIFVNDTLIYNGKYKLLSGSSLNVKYPAQAQTVRLEADQHPNHPGNSHPKAVVENCGTSPANFIPKGLVTTTPLDDLDDEVAIVCYPIRGSYDPNDKQASPTGIGLTHQVAAGTELDYTIRFQNTGTAMANTVKIVDTLDVNLDIASFTESVSSHPYTLTVTGKGQAVLTFTFNNINLPDSTSDKLGSKGLVSFKIMIPSNAPLGTVIHNKAYIYFDYNDAILTNNTMHTVGIITIENLSKGNAVQIENITTGLLYSQYVNTAKMYPNPSDGMVTLEMVESGSNMELRILSIVGVAQKTIKLTNTFKQQVNLEGVHQGMYLYEIWKDGERMSVGKLQIR